MGELNRSRTLGGSLFVDTQTQLPSFKIKKSLKAKQDMVDLAYPSQSTHLNGFSFYKQTETLNLHNLFCSSISRKARNDNGIKVISKITTKILSFKRPLANILKRLCHFRSESIHKIKARRDSQDRQKL